MTTLRSSSFLRLFVLPFVLSFWVSACTSMRVLEPPLERSLAAEQPSSVIVTLDDGEKLKIVSPTIRNDSIVGVRGDRLDSKQAHDQRLVVALDDVALVEHSEFSAGKTALWTLGLTAVLIVVGCAESDGGFGSLC